MSPGERERIIEGLIGRLNTEARSFEYEHDPGMAALRRMEVRALEDLQPAWGNYPDHLVGRQN